MVKKRTKEEWVKYLNKIHINLYDYSLSDFTKGVMDKIKVICKKHGMWEVTLDNHSTKKSGCPKCKGRKWNLNDFINEAKETHLDKYDYSNSIFINQNTKLEIECPKHGIFEQTPHHHIFQKQGCFKCGREISSEKHTKSPHYLEQQARKIHFMDYKYRWETYVGYLKIMEIECLKHGIFKQTIANHIQGQGCPICKKSKGELKIRQWLIENQIEFIHQKKFNGCINPNIWYSLMFDFYVSSKNVCIEFDGEQHFKPCKRFGGKVQFDKTKYLDYIKDEYCIKNNINILRIPYTEIKNIHNILKTHLLK
jgi:very-short-patch-repair endonuclease